MDLVGFPINRHLAAVPQRFPTATSHRLATLLSWGALLRIVTGDHDEDTFEDRASWFSTTAFHFYNSAESIDGTSGGKIKILRPLLQFKHFPNMTPMTFI